MDTRSRNNSAPVTQQALFDVLELTLNDGPKEMKQKAQVFKDLWACATPDVRAAKNQEGQNILHQMVVYGFNQLIPDLLKEMPSLVREAQKKDREYPIHLSVASHQIEVAKMLLDIPGVTRLKNDLGQTALHYAARFGSQDMVKVCCDKYVGNTNEKDKYGKTPLALALAENTPDVEAVLIAYGADPNLVSDF